MQFTNFEIVGKCLPSLLVDRWNTQIYRQIKSLWNTQINPDEIEVFSQTVETHVRHMDFWCHLPNYAKVRENNVKTLKIYSMDLGPLTLDISHGNAYLPCKHSCLPKRQKNISKSWINLLKSWESHLDSQSTNLNFR